MKPLHTFFVTTVELATFALQKRKNHYHHD